MVWGESLDVVWGIFVVIFMQKNTKDTCSRCHVVVVGM